MILLYHKGGTLTGTTARYFAIAVIALATVYGFLFSAEKQAGTWFFTAGLPIHPWIGNAPEVLDFVIVLGCIASFLTLGSMLTRERGVHMAIDVIGATCWTILLIYAVSREMIHSFPFTTGAVLGLVIGASFIAIHLTDPMYKASCKYEHLS
jgi:hypothetical protein